MEENYIDINSVEDINESNYLLIDYRNLATNDAYSNLGNSLDQLWKTGRAIKNALDDGVTIDRLNSINNYYLEAVRWLKGQSSTTSWVAISPLDINSSNLNNDLTNFVTSWIPNYLSTFYQNTILVSYFILRDKLQEDGLIKEREKYLQEVSAIEENKVKNRIKKIKSEIDADFEAKLSRYKSLVALREWQQYYEKLIRQNKKTKKLKRQHEMSYFDEMKHYELWKNIWLWAFAGAFILSVVFQVYMGWTLSDNLSEILSIKIGISILFGTLFVSANKNYRIYANLYDQTKFRSVVSKTVQGIILDERLKDEDKRILLTVAAQSLFEMKVSGHLTKKDSGTPANDLLLSILSRKE